MRPSVPVLRLPDAHGLELPKYADGVGTTLTLQAAISVPLKLDVGQSALIPTGFAFTVPLGMEAQVRSHRELSETTGLIVLNAPATIDSSNQEEVKVLLYNKGENAFIVRRGQDIASLVFSPVLRVKWDEVNPPVEKDSEKTDMTPILAQSSDENLTPAVVKEALRQANVTQAQTPVQAQTQAPVQAQAQTPVQAQTQVPVQAQAQTPVQAQTQAPVQAQTQAPVQAQAQTPVQAQTQVPVQAQAQTPVQAQTQAPVQAQAQTPVKAQTQAPVQAQAQTPVQAQTQVPAQARAQISTQVQTSVQAQASSQAQTTEQNASSVPVPPVRPPHVPVASEEA